MLISKIKSYEIDYGEFEVRILQQMVPAHIPAVQWKEYLGGIRDRKEREEKEANQYSKQESKSERITEICGTKNI